MEKDLEYFEPKNISRILFYLLILMSMISMSNLTLLYFPFRSHIEFLEFKELQLKIPLWRFAFYTHICSSIVIFISGGLNFLFRSKVKFQFLHRCLGHTYFVGIMVIGGPSGVILAYFANGGTFAKMGFLTLATLWMYFTLRAYISVRHSEFLKHKLFMIRSYSLTMSAVTLRVWMWLLTPFVIEDTWVAYSMAAWLGFVPNLIFAEFVITKIGKFEYEK